MNVCHVRFGSITTETMPHEARFTTNVGSQSGQSKMTSRVNFELGASFCLNQVITTVRGIAADGRRHGSPGASAQTGDRLRL
jgi:hypothetical protein